MFISLMLCGWLAPCAWLDWHTRQVPNWLTLPLILTAFGVRFAGFARGTLWLGLVLILLTLTGWFLQAVGGADLKVTIALAVLDPRLALWAWSGVLVLYIFMHLIHRPARQLPALVGFLLGTVLFLFGEG